VTPNINNLKKVGKELENIKREVRELKAVKTLRKGSNNSIIKGETVVSDSM
jgi:hypothetical protein